MVWPLSYEQRLAEWHRLRESNLDRPLPNALLNVNDWWQEVPWAPYYLHWDDVDTWPDPWDLLANQQFCSLAKALGIVYTLHMMERSDVKDLQIASGTDSADNLVLVNEGKYILNWDTGTLLNITSNHIQIKRTIDSRVVTKKIN
jgi:hypothetical protein